MKINLFRISVIGSVEANVQIIDKLFSNNKQAA